jgi:hypothetical protein
MPIINAFSEVLVIDANLLRTGKERNGHLTGTYNIL